MANLVRMPGSFDYGFEEKALATTKLSKAAGDLGRSLVVNLALAQGARGKHQAPN